MLSARSSRNRAGRARYGDGLIKGLSLKLTAEFGLGYTGASLRYMRLVYLAFPNCHTLCDKLSWSHYRTLACIENVKKRQFLTVWICDLAREAVEEALVNALVHRDWKLSASVEIRLFVDRVEIWTPGKLPEGLTIAKLFVSSAESEGED